jgi:nucleotide-binding universal stress UspA family protein
MIDLRNILLPIDFSEPSLTATEYALELTRRFGATLHLLHVIEDPVVYLPMFESYPMPSRAQFETYAQDRLENWIAEEDAEGCRVELQWVHGKPFVEIIRQARDHDADLIVMGTHGRGLTSHLLLGSVAEQVVRKSSCPVLTVHPSGHQFVR